MLYPDLKGTDRVKVDCTRCGGSGRVKSYVELGKCFQCNGAGYHAVLVSSLRAGAARRERKQAAYEARQAERAARQAEWDRLARERASGRDARDYLLAEEGVHVPTGRVHVEGVVLSTKYVPGFAYASGDVKKMVVETDDGWRVYGSVPTAILDVEKGDRVSFEAACEPSKDKPVFGFFKRPTKATSNHTDSTEEE